MQKTKTAITIDLRFTQAFVEEILDLGFVGVLLFRQSLVFLSVF